MTETIEKIEAGLESRGISLTAAQIKLIRSSLEESINNLQEDVDLWVECKKGVPAGLKDLLQEVKNLLERIPQPHLMALDEDNQFYNIHYEITKTYYKV